MANLLHYRSRPGGNSFHHSGNEFRRFRPSLKVGFLRYFNFDFSVNLVNDRRFAKGDSDWQFQNYDKTILTFDIRKAFDFRKAFRFGALDTLAISYGRQKLATTSEGLDSAERFLTIERSATASMLFGSRYPTGLNLITGKGPWLATFGIFTGIDPQSFAPSPDGSAYFTSFDYQLSDSWKLRADATLNQLSTTRQNIYTYDWGGSLNAIYDCKSFGLLTTLALGDNGTQPAGLGGSFYGVVVLPWFWIVPEKTQAVFQYNYSGSSQAAAIRANTRYLSGSQPFAPVNSGRGDELHTLYFGINQYLCDQNLRLMAGSEFAHLETPGGKVESLTTSFAVRMAF